MTAIPMNFDYFKKNHWIYLWFIRFLEYLVLFFVVTISVFILFWKFNVIPTENNSLSLLSLIIQVQATIISLVITLTLVAIQITAASYTSRVVDVMKKMPDMWILLFIYIGSMSIGIITLKFLTNPDPVSVSWVIILGIFSLWSLFLYIKNTIASLHPDQVVKMLVNEINSGNIHQKQGTDDIMQPVFDVVHASILRYDVTTARAGLRAISDRLLVIFLLCDNSNRKDISKQFCSHIQRSARVAQRNDDEEIILEIIEILEKFAIECCENKDSEILQPIIRVIDAIGINAADKGWEYLTWRQINTLSKIGVHVTKNGLGAATNEVASAIESINTHAADKGMENVQIIGNILVHLYKDAADNGLQDSTESIWRILSRVGQYNADKGAELATYRLIRATEELSMYTADKGQRCETWNIVNALVEIGKHVADKRMVKVALLEADSLERLALHISKTKKYDDIAEMAMTARKMLIETATTKN